MTPFSKHEFVRLLLDNNRYLKDKLRLTTQRIADLSGLELAQVEDIIARDAEKTADHLPPAEANRSQILSKPPATVADRGNL